MIEVRAIPSVRPEVANAIKFPPAEQLPRPRIIAATLGD
jgi:hypothetical protein